MKLSGFDKFILATFPKYGVSRLRARETAAALARHYEAATGSRRTSGWARSLGDADVVTRGALVELRMHARDLVRNNAWAKKAQRKIANHAAGRGGIRPKATGETPEIRTKAMQLWKSWAESTECESEGRHTFYGLQHLAMKSIATDGEILFRRRWRKPKDDLTLPLQVQVLEADFLDHTRNVNGGSLAGGPIIAGVEYDLLGRRAAYWIWPVHPGSGRNSKESQRIPASEIIHVCYAERPGQSRGISWFGSSIAPLKDFDEYEDATLTRQRVAACFAAFVQDLDGLATPLGTPGQANGATDETVETLEPGLIQYLTPGKSIAFANPPAVTEDGSTARNLRRIAASLLVTYEDLTGDYSQVNFSSARMAQISHWGDVTDWQTNMLIPLLCQGVWQWAMEAAQLSGELPADAEIGSDWTCPPRPMIEPDKEGLAYQRLVRVGAMTPSEMVREQGGDPEAHWDEYAADMATFDRLKLKLDSDVRAVSQAGLTQVRAGVSDASSAAASSEDTSAPPSPAKAKRDLDESDWVEVDLGGDL